MQRFGKATQCVGLATCGKVFIYGSPHQQRRQSHSGAPAPLDSSPRAAATAETEATKNPLPVPSASEFGAAEGDMIGPKYMWANDHLDRLWRNEHVCTMHDIAVGKYPSSSSGIVVVDVETDKNEIVEIGAVAVDERGELLGGGNPVELVAAMSPESIRKRGGYVNAQSRALARCTPHMLGEALTAAAKRGQTPSGTSSCNPFFNSLARTKKGVMKCPRSVQVHGITNARASKAWLWADVERHFEDYFRRGGSAAPKEKVICVAHNIVCERRVLPKYATGDMLCTLGAFRVLFPGKKATLLDCCNFFGISACGMQLHAAIVDAVVTAQLLKCLLEVVASLPAKGEGYTPSEEKKAWWASVKPPEPVSSGADTATDEPSTAPPKTSKAPREKKPKTPRPPFIGPRSQRYWEVMAEKQLAAQRGQEEGSATTSEQQTNPGDEAAEPKVSHDEESQTVA